jgi:predicted RND superfamily exporter protein
MAVALNGVTTMVGFGSMLVARHQGIHGLGLFLTLGSACGLLASLVVLPALLGRLSRQAAKADQAVGSSAA